MAIIAINPGHYIEEENYDPGACNELLGLREVDVNIAVAKLLQSMLQELGHEVVYIHRGELYEITKESNEASVDLFISIHCNSASSDKAVGIETFYCKGSTKGEQLATFIQEAMVGLELVDRGVKNNGLYVTKNTNAVAVLVELGFLSNTNEGTRLGTAIFHQQVADAICRAIVGYLW